MDTHKNFPYSTVATAPSPATSGTSVVVQTGDGANFPAAATNGAGFWAVIWPAGAQPTVANAEIVRVTARSTDTFTIVRAAQSTSARTVIVGDQIAANVTVPDVDTQRKAISDAAYTVGTTDAQIYNTYTYTSISTNRIFTLCAANVLPAGTRIRIEDGSGSVTAPTTGSNGIEIQVKPAGSDTVEGIAAATNFEVIRDARGSLELETDGSTNWSIVAVVPHNRVEAYTATASAGYRTPLTAHTVRCICIAGGGAGGSGEKRASGTATGGGGGGDSGAFTEMFIDASALSATETPTVGTGGTGGGATTSAGNGANGGNGNPSSFSVAGTNRVTARGGAGGTGGTGGVGGIGTGGALGTTVGVAGGTGASGLSSAVAAVGSANSGICGAGAGGGGGGRTAGAATEASAAGGTGSQGVNVTNTGTIIGGIAGGAGNPGSTGGAGGAATTAHLWTGGGGGGGGGNGNANPSAGGTGGVGGVYGGGGGGGGAAVGTGGGSDGGNGGAGGAGIVVLISYR